MAFLPDVLISQECWGSEADWPQESLTKGLGLSGPVPKVIHAL